ncbi:MAG: MBL fold metallo-hydrolase [Bacteroidetes bacterium HGW-Bacteroidetes-6]|jgi:phosphoribosyl 1,2-cyclic phosphate phosphodiesterase|nr:MAG: MBL fold metallo-hydrolase [Bacteroidetes bacterium HGW-Bacteroidetes-6]
MKNRITFLGTGTSTGVPVLTCSCEVCCSTDIRDKRLRTSAYVECGNVKILIDCGPDFRQQLLSNRISDFDAILLTHGHRDHIAGLDEVRAFNYIRNKKVEIFASETTAKSISTEFPYIFEPGDYKGAPKINISEISDLAFFVENLKIQPLPVLHGEAVIQGFKIGGLVYITDASHIDDCVISQIGQPEILVLNALRKKKHPTHFSLDEAVGISRKVNARRTFFTHISHFLGKYDEISAQLPDSVFLAYDGLTVEY